MEQKKIETSSIETSSSETSSKLIDTENVLIGSTIVEIGSNSIGSNTLSCNTGSCNNAFGENALKNNNTGSDNNGIGYNALQSNTTGINNQSMGTFSLHSNTIGQNNVAIGHNSLGQNVSGNCNVAIGNDSLIYNTTGNNNTAIGYNSGPIDGKISYTTSIGINAIPTASNQIMLGGDSNGYPEVIIPGELTVEGAANFTSLPTYNGIDFLATQSYVLEQQVIGPIGPIGNPGPPGPTGPVSTIDDTILYGVPSNATLIGNYNFNFASVCSIVFLPGIYLANYSVQYKLGLGGDDYAYTVRRIGNLFNVKIPSTYNNVSGESIPDGIPLDHMEILNINTQENGTMIFSGHKYVVVKKKMTYYLGAGIMINGGTANATGTISAIKISNIKNDAVENDVVENDAVENDDTDSIDAVKN